MNNREYEDWHRYGRERGFFDRASDEVRSWFGDEDAERRRKMDAQTRGSRGGSGWFGRDDHESGRAHDDMPSWQRRDYGGPSPRGGELEGHGRYDIESTGMGRMRGRQMNGDNEFGYGNEGRWGSEGRYGNEGRWGSEGRYGNESRFGREEYGMGRRGNYGTQFFGGRDRDFETGMGYSVEERPRRGLFGGEHRGGMFEREENRSFFGGGYEREGMMRDRERSGMYGMSHQGRGPRNYQRSDERISDEIHQILTMHPQIDATEIDVLVEKGVVTLRGKVDNRMTKRTTEDIVEDVFGVREVHNELRVDNGLLQRPLQQDNQPQTPKNNLINR